MNNSFYRTKEYWVDNFIRFLLDGKREITADEIETRKEVLGLKWLKGPFVVAMIAPEYSGVKHTEKDSNFGKIEEYVSEVLKKHFTGYYCLTNSYNNISVLMCMDGAKVKPELTSFFIELKEKLTDKFGLEVYIGIGSVAENYKDIVVSASDAMEMLSFKYQYADSGVINIATMVQFQYNMSRGNGIEFDRVIGCFIDGNLGKMEIRLNELVETVRHRANVSKTSIRRTLVEVTVQILHTASNANVDVDKVLNNTDPYNWIMKQNHTEVITEWIMKLSSELLNLINNRRENEEKHVIQQAKQFIEENLARVDLGLSQISKEVNLSDTYFSQLFKNEVGMGVNAYITQNRIARAQILLKETELTAADISKQIGFMSPGYFGQVFRKVTGITPQEYRRNS